MENVRGEGNCIHQEDRQRPVKAIRMLFRNDKYALTLIMSGSVNNCSRSVLSILTKKDSPLISGSLIVNPWWISSTDCRMISLVNEFTKVSNIT